MVVGEAIGAGKQAGGYLVRTPFGWLIIGIIMLLFAFLAIGGSVCCFVHPSVLAAIAFVIFGIIAIIVIPHPTGRLMAGAFLFLIAGAILAFPDIFGLAVMP